MNNEVATEQKNRFQELLSGLSTNWHFLRWLRAGLGLFLTWQTIQRPDIFTGVVAAFFLFQAFTNTGCGGTSGCSVPANSNKKSSAK